jgi:two-component system response regulator AtoC
MAKLFHRISAFRSPSRVARATRRHPGPRKPSSIFAQRVKKRVSGLSRGARDKLVQYEYPGNVRELRNIVERAVILTRAQEIQLDDIVLPRTESAAHGNYPAFFSVDLKLDGDPPTAEQIEQAYVKRDLDYYAGKRTQAAQALGVSYPTFLRRLRELGLDE